MPPTSRPKNEKRRTRSAGVSATRIVLSPSTARPPTAERPASGSRNENPRSSARPPRSKTRTRAVLACSPTRRRPRARARLPCIPRFSVAGEAHASALDAGPHAVRAQESHGVEQVHAAGRPGQGAAQGLEQGRHREAALLDPLARGLAQARGLERLEP